MTPDEQADALARWLSEPASRPPEGLDPDVVEAVYALRPDLAPAPSIDLDDLLAGVTVGPLAAPGGAGAAAPAGPPAEVVAFPTGPGSPLAEGARAPRSTWARWVAFAGGTSSLGLLAAAAAVLVFVVLPTSRELRLGAEPTAAPAAAPDAEPAAAEPAAAEGLARPAPMPQARAAARPAGVPAPPAPPEVAEAPLPPPPPAVADMASDESVVRQRAAIPELEEQLAAAPPPSAPVGGVAGNELDADLGGVSAAPVDPYAGEAVADVDDALGAPAATEEADDVELRKENRFAEEKAQGPLDAVEPAAAPPASAARAPAQKSAAREVADPRARATPRDLSGQGWRRGLDPAAAQPFEAALAEADALRRAGDPASAAARLASAVAPPARAGQRVAADSARDWLSAGDPGRAESVARQGLALSSANTPERSQLLLVLGDALAARGDAAGAAEAWAEAAGLNAAR